MEGSCEALGRIGGDRPRLTLLALALLAAGALLLTGAPAASAQAPLQLDAGSGETLRIDEAPFRLSLVSADGSERVGTLAGLEGPPVSIPGIDGPSPANPTGTAGGYPSFGFVYGASPGLTFPVSFFQGNRLFGAEAGALVSLVEIDSVVEQADDRLVLDVRTDAVGLPPARMTIERLPGGGIELDLEPPDSSVEPVGVAFTLASPTDEGLYGLGARKDTFDQRGRLRNVWTEQQNATSADGEVITGSDPTRTTGPDYTFPNGAQAAYYVQAALHGSRGWSAWVSQSELSRIDLANTREDAVRWGVASPRLTLALAGGGLAASSRSYTAEVGRAPAPPRYAFEPWIDVINEGEGEAAPNGQGFSGGERVRADLEMIVRKAEETNTPIGTLGVEGWQAVPDGPDFFNELRDRGYHLSAYWNMFTSEGTEAYDEAKALDIFVKDAAGNDYPIVTNRQGISYLIDFSHPDSQQFWKGQLDRSNDLGFEAFMHDFGELITEGMRFENGELPPQMHNHYPVLYHETARRALDAYAAENPGHEPFFYVRAGYSGVGEEPGVIAHSPSVFPGDETTDWAEGSGIPSVPPAMLNLALGGSFAFTTDVGGYLDLVAPPTSKELFIRWSQLAALTPISRIHNSTGGGSRYPWSFDEETVEIYRRYARGKVKLIPLVERWTERASVRGDIGPVRPLVLDDPSPEARSIDDQWLLGRNILVAPVITEGAREREVYLPAGSRWRQVVVSADGSLVAAGAQSDRQAVAAAAPLDGGQTVTAPAPLGDIPLFVRAGTAQDPGGPGGSGGDGGTGTDDGGGAGDGSGDDDSNGREDGDSDGGSVEGDSSGSDAADDAATGTTGGSLPFTGLGLGAMALLAVALIAVGLGARLPASRGK